MINSARNYFIPKRKQVLFIVFAWVLIQASLYLSLGIKPILESLKYIHAAQELLGTGQLPESRYIFYLSTTVIIAFCLKAKFGYAGVVIIQLLINFLATLCFFFSLYKLQRKPFNALLTTLALLIFIPFQSWNFYLYTESLFYSFTLLFFSSCIRAESLNIKAVTLQFVLLLLVIISRPLGILLLPCWIIYLITKSKKNLRKPLFIAFILALLVFSVISNFILSHISDWQILKSAENNYIICELPTGNKLNLDYLKGKAPLTQLFFYIINYPKFFISLAVKRLAAFLFLVRSYYSILHNAFLLLFCIILYLPIVLNSKRLWKNKRITNNVTLCLCIILSFCIAVCLQCDDYHNRFHNVIVPVLLYCGLFLFLENFELPLVKSRLER